MPFSILLCHMHCWKDSSWMSPKFRCYSPLDGLHSFKTCSSHDPLEPGEKVTCSNIRWIGRLFQYNVFLGLELSDARDIVSRYIAMMKQPQFLLPQKHVKKTQKKNKLQAKITVIYSKIYYMITQSAHSVPLLFRQTSYDQQEADKLIL